jgi:light-regulated signal transduction histidine kinase (bacteriophytochrome)
VSIEDLTKEIIQILSIQQQNKKLREIAWTQSHIVRAPVARIMGLIKFLTDESDISIQQKEVYDMILQSSNELDEIIKGIVYKTQKIQNDENKI